MNFNYFFRYLHLHEVGLIELLLAFYPIIGQYSWGMLHLNSLTLIVIDILIILLKRSRTRFDALLLIFILFCLFKQLLCFFISKSHPTMGSLFYDIVIVISIPIISSNIDPKRFIGSISWVTILCLLGILYHYSLFLSGRYEYINPLTLPFLEFDSTSRALDEISRPTSFFWEPASYAVFMIIPIFYYLYEKKYVISTILILSVFLSGSTNGIFFVFVLLLSRLIFTKFRFSYLIISILLIGITYYALYNYKGFEVGVKKMENTDYENNVRIANGPRLVSKMPIDHLLIGFPSPTVEKYLEGNHNINQVGLGFQVTKTGNKLLFVSDFWRILAHFGVIGLALLLICYFSKFRRCVALRPYIIVLLVSLFTQSLVLGLMWTFEWIFIISFVNLQKKRSIKDRSVLLFKKRAIGIKK